MCTRQAGEDAKWRTGAETAALTPKGHVTARSGASATIFVSKVAVAIRQSVRAASEKGQPHKHRMVATSTSLTKQAPCKHTRSCGSSRAPSPALVWRRRRLRRDMTGGRGMGGDGQGGRPPLPSGPTLTAMYTTRHSLLLLLSAFASPATCLEIFEINGASTSTRQFADTWTAKTHGLPLSLAPSLTSVTQAGIKRQGAEWAAGDRYLERQAGTVRLCAQT